MPAVFPPGLKPMLASTADPFDSPEFLFEPKWDGFRCLAYVGKHSTQLKSRNGSDLTGHFPELALPAPPCNQGAADSRWRNHRFP